jgi:hypothetical protein
MIGFYSLLWGWGTFLAILVLIGFICNAGGDNDKR